MKGNGERKVVPVLFLTEYHAIKRTGGVKSYLYTLSDFGTRWRLVARFTPRKLYPQGKSPRYTLDRRLGGPQSRSGCGGLVENFEPPAGFEPRSSSPWSVVIPTELSGSQCESYG
jgi:hypothetical protein